MQLKEHDPEICDAKGQPHDELAHWKSPGIFCIMQLNDALKVFDTFAREFLQLVVFSFCAVKC